MIFFGTSSLSLHVLDRLLELGIKPDHIVTVPDQPQGRKMLLTPPPAKVWAERHGVPFLQFAKLDAEAVTQLKDLQPDLFVVASYGKIIPETVLSVPAKGTVNIHPSLLPKYRGATPLQSTILHNDEAGVTLMQMDKEMDHGPILAITKVAMEPWPVRYTELEYTLARTGAEMLADYISDPTQAKFAPKEQDHTAATFTKKIEKEDGLIPSELITFDEGFIAGKDGWTSYLKYLAFEVWPGLYFFADKGTKKIRTNIKKASWDKATERMHIERVTPEGKKEMSWKDFQHFLKA